MTGTIVCDLDGVVYLGDQEVPGAGAALQRLHTAGFRLLFATNNSSRTRAEGAAKISRVTGYQTDRDQFVSSATAAEPPRRRTAMVCDERDRARGRGSALPAARLALVVVVLVAAVAGTALLLGNWRAGPREPSPDAPLSGDGDDAGRADAGRDDPRTTGADVRLEVDAETDAAASSDDDVEPVRRRPDRPRPLVGPPTPADPSLPGLRPGSPDGEVDPGPPELDARRLVDELEAHRRRRGLRRGDDEEADRLRAELDAALRRATPQDRLERVADAYRQRLESVAIDRAFIERKMQRATARIHAAGATPELDALSQQALRQAMAGDYAGANQSLNRILDATSR